MASKRKSHPIKDVRISPEVDTEEYNGSRNGDVKDENDWCYGLNKHSSTPQSLGTEDGASMQDETSSSGNKEDEEDDEDDSDDLKSIPHDPERLKAFNMFVRLFVDENLDRIVPISKQPKDKIQAIIDSCQRQFPEFGDRARKRIRTYLKSCRRNKRTRDQGFEPARPTPAHLTSAAAEQILATACENEAHNAKRMRLGLEPVSQPMPVIPVTPMETDRAIGSDGYQGTHMIQEDTKPVIGSGGKGSPNHHTSQVAKEVQTLKPHSNSIPVSTSTTATNSISSLYRGGIGESGGRPSPTAGPEPTDLSVRPRLSMQEITSVRRLVAGYRESAAFLLRSADELEQLLLHQ